MRFVVVTALIGACCAGCASPQRVTWDELDANRGQSGVTEVAVSAAGGGPPMGVAADTVSAGIRIDRALQELLSARVKARQQPKTSPLWTEAWLNALRTISSACEVPPRASDLGAFVRARVTLEVELQRDLERGVILPAGLDKLVRQTLGAVDENVVLLRAANAPGTMAPVPRLEPGELMLHAPLAPLIVSSPFGPRLDPIDGGRRFHAGVDLDAPEGATVYASASGLVVYAGSQGGYGKQVVVDHGDGVRTHYSHCSSILVRPGQLVEEGDSIALVGSTGRSTGPHLHFAVSNEAGEFVDPMAVFDVPYAAIAGQVKSGGKSTAKMQVKQTGDTIEVTSLGAP